MKAVIVTGTPGTGKTTFAKALCRAYSLQYIDVNRFISEHRLSTGYDKVRDCEIVDTLRLAKELSAYLEGRPLTVIDSHLSQCLATEDVLVCFVTKCDIKVLRHRLQKRGYDDKKVRENLDAEIFDVCLAEAQEAGHNVHAIWTDRIVDMDSLERFIKPGIHNNEDGNS